jgi:nitric oxide reductase NorQ protein
MPATQATRTTHFATVLEQTPDVVEGRWAAIAHGQPVAKPAARRDPALRHPGASAPAVNAIAALVTGLEAASIRFVTSGQPAIVAEVNVAGRWETISYRLLDDEIIHTAMIGQPPVAAIPVAARLLLGRSADFAAAYGALLAGIEAGTAQAELNELMLTCADELLVGIEHDLANLDGAKWFCTANTDPKKGPVDIEEVNDVGDMALETLLKDRATFEAYQKGEQTPFDALANVVPSTGATQADPTIDTTGFVGPQLAETVRHMKAGRHILHHGPTGTGKSFVWELAMRQIDPAFDPDSYIYFVHGSAGLEDIDFVGQPILDAEGNRRWVDGPLLRAMREGKRLKVEEINRLPGSMLNVLLGAMDYGRIAVPRLGLMVTAAPGFAVDAMANIGSEYTATEEIDPAILRRFQVKIEYDFLPKEREVALLMGRHGITREQAETLVRIAATIRDAYEQGTGGLDVDMYVSPASLLQAAQLVAEGETIKQACELTFMVEVAKTKAKREKVRDVIDGHTRTRAKRGR